MAQIHRVPMALAVAWLCAGPGAFAQSGVEAGRHLHGGRSASDLIGSRVRSADGDDVGEVEDLLLSADGTVVTAVVSVGGVLDIADKLVAVPYRELHVSADNTTLAIPLTKAQVEAAPSYKAEPPAVGEAAPIVDPARSAPPDAATQREASEEAARVFAGDDPRVGDGIAENKKAYEDDEAVKREDVRPRE